MKEKELEDLTKVGKFLLDEIKKIAEDKHKLVRKPDKEDKEFLGRIDNELKQGCKCIKDSIKAKNGDISYAVDMFSNASITANQLRENSKTCNNKYFEEICAKLDELKEKTTECAYG